MNGRASSLSSFSLVEVVIALGVVTFCLVILVALLPVGLQSTRQAQQYSAAASGVEKIADAIREASPTTNQHDQCVGAMAAGNYSNLVWQIGGPEVTFSMTNISLSGDPVFSSASEPELTAHIQLTPPTNLVSSGTALISIAWPSKATWVSSATNWAHAEGSVSTWFIFVPKP